MAKSPAFLVRSVVQALALLVLVVAGWAAPQQAVAATEYLSADAVSQAGSRQLRSRSPQALDWPRGDRCALTRKNTDTRAESRRRNGAADAGIHAPAGDHAILDSAGIAYSRAGGDWQPVPTDRGIGTAYPAAFQSRAPPFHLLVTSIA